ncbi:MAG TPA: hypothetical protein EYP22_00495 [Methanosarcinales archaeon]|nr:hypothetical protein [Methanosarcinales archaeon]
MIEYILKKEIINELTKVLATKEELFATKEELKEEINKIWNEINKLRLETMRMFYLIILILIILNGDKIINFLKFLIK